MHTAYNFSFLGKAFDGGSVRTLLSGFEATAQGGWPSWTFSNHDSMRLISRWPPPIDQTGLATWRRQRPALVTGDLQFQPGDGPVLAFRRKSGNHPSVWCAFNFSGRDGTCGWHGHALSQFAVHAHWRAGEVSLGPYGFVLLEENAG